MKFYEYGKAQPIVKYTLLCYSKDVLLHPSKKVVERLAARRKSNAKATLNFTEVVKYCTLTYPVKINALLHLRATNISLTK